MKLTEDQLKPLEELMMRIMNARPGDNDAFVEVTAELQQLVSAGYSALHNPRPRLVLLGLVNQKKWRAMKGGVSRFTLLYPIQHPRNGENFSPVYGIEADD